MAMNNTERNKLFQEVQKQIAIKGFPFKVPPSLFVFVSLEDIKQEFYVGISRRLLKVRKHVPNTNTSPPIGYVLDGGTKAVKDMIRQVYNEHLLPYCGCKVWSPKNITICSKCGEKTAHAEIFSSTTDVVTDDVRDIYDTLYSNPAEIAMARVTLSEFETLLKKHHSTKMYELFKILCGADLRPCAQCKEQCKNAISMFEQKNKKFSSGCVNFRVKVADAWGCSVARVNTVYKQLKKLAKTYGLG